ncbi:MAG: ribonuclease R [Bacteroidia bacterium]
MAKKKRSTGENNGAKSKRSIKSSLLNYLQTNPNEGLNYKQIAAQLGLNSHAEHDILLAAIEELIADGYLEEKDRGKYKPVLESQYVEGKVDMTKTGAAFIVVEGLEDDIHVQPAKTKNALHGDKVKVLLYARRKGKRPEGEVVEILERKKMEFTGILQVHEKFAFLIADNKKMSIDIFIPISKLNGGVNGEKALVKIIDWPEGAKSPIGRVERVLGKPGEHDTEMNAIIAEFGLPEEFPKAAEREADAIIEEISEAEIEKRWDFRGIPTFTIDPADAKDFDDALSIRKLPKNLWEIGIHIADVSHYLQEGTALDAEALERATSVYLVDRVIPMLPENLSNHLCSLRPDEDKLTFSVVVVMDEDAKIKKEWYGRTVIRSIKRFSYEDAQEVLETGVGPYAEELLTLNKLAHKLRDKKFAEGAISFETEEVKFKLDDNGKPLYVYKKVRKDAHKLIEDFMLLANRKVAEFIFKKNTDLHERPFVYRVHDTPDKDKLAVFAKVAAQFGHKLNFKTEKNISKSLNQLLIDVEGKPEQSMLQSLAIRTMPKAIYTTMKTSHYGLAFAYYTHFTSPIRRYPDVIAHRLLAHYLMDKKDIDQSHIEAQAKHSTEMEIRAAEAERASIKYKQVEFMQDKVGETFAGIISGVTEWGIYVEIIENKCEGMVRLTHMKDDYYSFEEERYLIRGVNTGKTYQLGDLTKVKVVEANLTQRTIDFEFVDADEDEIIEEVHEAQEKEESLPEIDEY